MNDTRGWPRANNKGENEKLLSQDRDQQKHRRCTNLLEQESASVRNVRLWRTTELPCLFSKGFTAMISTQRLSCSDLLPF